MVVEIVSGSNTYRVGEMVAETDGYRVYLCTQQSTGRQCLLQIATATVRNGGLDRAAYILKELERKADELEMEYAKVKTDPEKWLNYNLGFPELVDGFICEEQGRRRVNVLAFRHVEDVSRMVPLVNLASKDRLRVDLRTSTWIMGKLLKLLVFAHGEGIAVGQMIGSNILIEPKEHYVLIFDWSLARGVPTAEDCQRDIAQAAQTVIGATSSGSPVESADMSVYTDFLMQLARGVTDNAREAHEQFYEIVDSLWSRGYYPFTTLPLCSRKED